MTRNNKSLEARCWIKLYRALFISLLAILAASCSDGRTPLVLYSPHGRDLLSLLESEYEKANPTIDVRWLDMGSQEVYDRIRSEAANSQADVWFGGPDIIFSRGAGEGLLAPFRPAWADFVPLTSRRADNLYFGVYRAVPILIFNSAAIEPADAPADWDDLLAPEWKSKIIIRDPLASGTMRTAFGMIIAKSVATTGNTEQGLDWLRRLDSQTKEYVVNPALLFEKLSRQEGLVSIWELTDLLFLQQRGAPLDYNFPSSGTPVIDDAIGLVAGAAHPDEAKAFIDWVGSREALLLAAREAFRLPARQDLPAEELPEWAQVAMQQIVEAEVDWNLISDQGSAWMALWDREVRGKGSN